MQSQDHALLVMASCGFIMACAFYFYRRNIGNSHSVATMYAIWVFGAIQALGFIFGLYPYKNNDIGLDRIVVPIVVLFFTGITSVIVALMVSILEGRTKKKTYNSAQDQIFTKKLPSIALKVQELSIDPTWPDWKKFAFQVNNKRSQNHSSKI